MTTEAGEQLGDEAGRGVGAVRTPNESGELLLTAADNELVISAEGGSRTVIATGFYVFANVKPQEMRRSELLLHNLESGMVAVVLGLEETELIRGAGAVRINVPTLMAESTYVEKAIRISLKDLRQPQQVDTTIRPPDDSVFGARLLDPSGAGDRIIIDPDVRTYRVRWWAIPA